MARPLVTGKRALRVVLSGQGLGATSLWGSWNAGFRFSHQRGEAGAVCSGVLACGQKSGRGGGGRGGSSLWISMSSGRLGKSRASSFAGQQALLLHPLVEDQVKDPECADVDASVTNSSEQVQG